MTWPAVLASLGLVVVAAVTPSCGEREEEAEVAPGQRVDDLGRVVLGAAEREALDLETVTAEEGTLTTSTLRFGAVIARPQEDALVVAPLTARLTTFVATLGAVIAEGDALVVVEPLVDTASRASLEAELRQLRGQVESAQAQVEAKEADLSRVSTLVATGLATEADRAQVGATLRSERARADSLLRASAELGRATGGTLTLQAPASGTVAALAIGAGSLVQQGDVLARIVRSGPRWIDVAVPPGDPVGDAYRARGVLGDSPATLLVRGSVVEPDGVRRDRLEVDVDAAPNLLPGATVPVEVLHEFRGVLVPAEAVLRRGREKLVFVEVEEGRFAPRTVQVAARESERAALTSGLSAGERVVTRGAASLLGELLSSDFGKAQE